jgi:predicted Zn-dependent protease
VAKRPAPAETRPATSFRRRLVVALLSVIVLGLAAHFGWQGWGGWQYRQAEQAMNRRDFQAAREHLTQCLRVWPQDIQTLLLAAQAARRDGVPAECDRLLDAAEQAGAVREAVVFERDLAVLQSGDLAAAGQYLNVYREHPAFAGRPLILEAIIVGSLRAMDLPRARESLDLWEAQQPSVPDQTQLALWRGELEIRSANVAAATGHFRRAIELAPSSREARLKLVQVLAQADPAAAQEHLAYLLQNHPHDPEVLYQQAVAARNLGELAEAEAALAQLLARSPEHVDALVLRGRVALDRQQLDDAGKWLAEAERLAPQRHGVVLALVDHARLTGQPDRAQQYEARLAEVVRRIQEQVGIQKPDPAPHPVVGPAPQ